MVVGAAGVNSSKNMSLYDRFAYKDYADLIFDPPVY
jgi:hypothetical protein